MAALLMRSSGKNKIGRMTERLYHTELGCTLVSAVFGVALAFMFQRVCKGSHCVVYRSPPTKDIDGVVCEDKNDGSYTYTAKIVPCE